ncbi:MAG: hypothetical protein V7752_20590 [Halopseudomonas sp.]
MERTERDFSSRSDDEQQAFLTQTWCDKCQQPDLGMRDPVEYAQGKMVVIEGKCCRCGGLVATELTDENF